VLWRVEVCDKDHGFDSGVKRDIEDLGIKGAGSVEVVQVYIIKGGISRPGIKRIAGELLTDPVTQAYSFRSSPITDKNARAKNRAVVEVTYNAGVMDPVEESVKKGILDLGVKGVESVKTAKKYIISGKISTGQLKTISEKLLFNKVIQHVVTGPDSYNFKNPPQYHFKLITVDLPGSSDKDLEQISKKGQLFLSLAEMRRIREYFRTLGREPTDVELETLAQTWSEHCGHKTFRGMIDYESGGKRRLINNLLKETIMKATAELNKPWCVSVFKDNSGVIRFDGKYNVCF